MSAISIYIDIILAREAVAEAEINPWARTYPEAGTDDYPSDVHSHTSNLFSRSAESRSQPQPGAKARAEGHVPLLTPKETQATQQYLENDPDTGKPNPFLQGTDKTISGMGGNGQVIQVPNDAYQPSKRGRTQKAP